MKRRLAAMTLLTLATAGCGLTVPLDEHASIGAQQVGDTSVGDQPGASAAPTSAGTTDGAQTTTADGTTSLPGDGSSGVVTAPVPGTTRSNAATATTGGTKVSPTKGGTTKATKAPTKASASKATSTPIKVGVIYASGITGAASALGIKGLSTGDTVAQAKALAADINAHGGISGRQVTIVPESATNVSSAAQAQQEECTALTQDNHVDVVADFSNAQYQLATCLAAAHVTYLNDEASFGPATAANLGKYWYGPGDLSLDRQVKNEVEALVAAGWMTKNNKIGIYGYTHDDSTKALNDTMKPLLAKLGIPVVSVQQVDDSNATTAGNTVALNFRSAGVDRVLNVDGAPLFIMEAASNQGYHPLWALQSGFGPGVLLEQNAPKDELVGSLGAGYLPFYDIGAGTRPVVSANQTRCNAIMAAAGQGTTDTSTLAFEGQECDMFFFLNDAGKAGGGVTGPQLGAGAAALGTWPSAATFSSSFPGGRATGAGAYRLLGYDESCSCFQYKSDLKPLD